MIDITAAINEVNSFFIYRADKRDEHLLLSPKQPYGDCEDYALTVLLHICDGKRLRLQKALKHKDAALILCRDPSGAKHNILRYGILYCDNWQKRWVTRDFLRDAGYSKLQTTHPGTVIRRIKQGRNPDIIKRLLSWLPF